MNSVIFKHISHCWAALTAEEIYRLGCKQVCIAPGSRSTPLVMAFANHSKISCHTHFDERSLGFYALGLAKSSESPVVIVTTSGSAVANLLPAVVEAFKSRIPLLILSSDRPYQQHYHGENQTITQQQIFGHFVKLFQNIPSPTTSISPSWILATIDEAYYKMTTGDSAPVHLNLMFEEPFFNEEKSFKHYLSDISSWINSSNTLKNIQTSTTTLNHTNKNYSFKNIIAVVGHISNTTDAKSIVSFCKSKHIPVITECHSKIFGIQNTIHCVDLFIDLFHKNVKSNYTVLFFGDQIISKKCLNLLKNATHLVHISDIEQSSNPILKSSLTLKSSYSDSISYLNSFISDKNITWYNKLSTLYSTLLKSHKTNKYDCISEISILNTLFSNLQKHSLIFVANSLAIRILNHYIFSPHHHLIYANRGASGIDGNLSTAIGIAKDQKKELYFVCGDLSFLYDINALVLLQQSNVKIKIILLNNNGGKIFTFLPVKKHFNQLNPFFTTPHNLKMKHISKQFNLEYDIVEDPKFKNLDRLIKKHINANKSTLLECFFDESNTKRHIDEHTSFFLQ